MIDSFILKLTQMLKRLMTHTKTDSQSVSRYGVAIKPLDMRRCPCGETRMQGYVETTGEWICWAGHIITHDGKIAEYPADIFIA